MPSPPATPIATPIASPSASPFATPLVETIGTPEATPAVSPPSTPPDGGFDDGIVFLIVIVVLGTVVLVAWLLKPLVARRLTEGEVAGRESEPSEPPVEAWTWDLARRDPEAGPTVPEAVPAADAPAAEVDAPDSPGFAPESDTVTEPTPDGDATAEPVVNSAEPAGNEPVSPIEEPEETIDTGEIVGITLTVRELLELANAGQLLRGFDLYSESYLQRFRAETGLTDEQFADEYGSIPAPPPDARVSLAAVSDIEALPDGRVGALISFGNGGVPPRPERFVFVHVAGRWLIDDITSID